MSTRDDMMSDWALAIHGDRNYIGRETGDLVVPLDPIYELHCSIVPAGEGKGRVVYRVVPILWLVSMPKVALARGACAWIRLADLTQHERAQLRLAVLQSQSDREAIRTMRSSLAASGAGGSQPNHGGAPAEQAPEQRGGEHTDGDAQAGKAE